MGSARASDRRPKLRVIAGGEQQPERLSATKRAEPIPDEVLIEAVLRGDASVAAELYDRLRPVVDVTLYRVLGGRHSDHEDLMQSSFEQIVKTLTARRFARACSLRSWASSLAAHVGLNALRSRVRERKLVDRSDAAVEERHQRAARDDPERDVTLRDEIARVRRELSQMNPQRAEALLLHDVLGHELAEIAALTNVSITAAQSRLVRARRELAQRLGGRS